MKLTHIDRNFNKYFKVLLHAQPLDQTANITRFLKYTKDSFTEWFKETAKSKSKIQLLLVIKKWNSNFNIAHQQNDQWKNTNL